MSTWTPKKDADLIRLREQERLAFSHIAEAIGVTRSAAIARYHRLRIKQVKVHARKPSREDRVVEQILAGRAIDAVANGFGFTRPEVVGILQGRGIDYERPEIIEYDVTPAWGWDDNAKRSWITNRARRGAREALKAFGGAA